MGSRHKKTANKETEFSQRESEKSTKSRLVSQRPANLAMAEPTLFPLSVSGPGWGSWKFGAFHPAFSCVTRTRHVTYVVTILSDRIVPEGSFHFLKVTENVRKVAGDSIACAGKY